MDMMTIASSELRVPDKARDALAHDRVVEVRRHNHPRPIFVLISPAAYEATRPVLRRVRRGLPAPVESLLDDDDFEIMALEHRQDEGLDQGALEPWV